MSLVDKANHVAPFQLIFRVLYDNRTRNRSCTRSREKVRVPQTNENEKAYQAQGLYSQCLAMLSE